MSASLRASLREDEGWGWLGVDPIFVSHVESTRTYRGGTDSVSSLWSILPSTVPLPARKFAKKMVSKLMPHVSVMELNFWYVSMAENFYPLWVLVVELDSKAFLTKLTNGSWGQLFEFYRKAFVNILRKFEAVKGPCLLRHPGREVLAQDNAFVTPGMLPSDLPVRLVTLFQKVGCSKG